MLASHRGWSAQEVLREYVLETKLDDWYSKSIRYQRPHVDRLYRQHGDIRICLHRIFPCELDAAYVHPHPWPCIAWTVGGGYEMGVYAGSFFGQFHRTRHMRPVCTVRCRPGGSWEMMEKDVSHYVCPSEVTHSILLMGEPWRDSAVNPFHLQADPTLGDEDKEALLGYFKSLV